MGYFSALTGSYAELGVLCVQWELASSTSRMPLSRCCFKYLTNTTGVSVPGTGEHQDVITVSVGCARPVKQSQAETDLLSIISCHPHPRPHPSLHGTIVSTSVVLRVLLSVSMFLLPSLARGSVDQSLQRQSPHGQLMEVT